MRRPSVVVALVALVVSGCGIPRDSRARTVGSDAVPLGLSETTTTSTTTSTTVPVATTTPRPTTTAATEVIRLYYVDGDNVNFVNVTRSAGVPPQTVLHDLAQKVGLRVGMRSSIPDGLLRGVTGPRDGAVKIDLNSSILEQVAGAEQATLFAQIVLTFTARPGVGTVTFTSDGAPVNAVIEDGSNKPVASKDDYPIWAANTGMG